MPKTQFQAARLLLITGLCVGPFCGCHSDGSVSPRPSGFGLMEPRNAGPQGVGAVRLNDQQKLEIQLALARTLEERDQPDRAEGVYRKILEQHPLQKRALHRLAVVCDRQQRFEESEALFRQALQAQPENSAVLGDFGFSLYRQRRWSEAEENLRQAIEFNPENRRAHNHLGLVLAQADRHQEALEAFSQAGCTRAQSHANLGLVAEMNGRLATARAEYEVALEADPANPAYRRRLERLKQMPSPTAASPLPETTKAEETPTRLSQVNGGQRISQSEL